MLRTDGKSAVYITQQEDGFFVKERKNGNITTSCSYSGVVPRFDLLNKCPIVWLWLLKHNVFSNERVLISKKTPSMKLFIIFDDIESYHLETAHRFESQTDFILSLIDKLEEVDSNGSDFMHLSLLESLCHSRKINLYDFFLSLERDLPLVLDSVSIPIFTSASIYHKAIAIIINAKGISYRDLSRLTGIERANLLTDKSDSFRGKRKTLEIRTLFVISNALEVSLSAFFSLCHMIVESNIYDILILR